MASVISGSDRHRQHIAGHHGGAIGLTDGQETAQGGAAEIAVVLLVKTVGKPWENGGLMVISMDFHGFTLWKTKMTVERSTMFNGKTHYK